MKPRLTIDNLAPYLPYGLKIKYKWQGIDEIIRTLDNPVNVLESTNTYQDLKPILRPLSDLTKEMLSTYFKHLMDDDLEYCIKETKEWPLHGSYSFTTEFLLKNHFDVFGLIPEGLAVDINTI